MVFNYGDFSMKKGIEWVKNHWFTAGIIAVFLVVVGGIFAVLMGWWDIIDPKGATSQGDLLRNLILCIGAIGGVYGLHLATERQKTFSHQGFNDRLGRGVELLAKDGVVMRCAGLQILEDLVDNADDGQREIVLNIIYNFFRDNAKINIEDGNEPRFRTREDTTQDLQDALDILINLSLDDREKLLPKRLVAVWLNFSKLDFSHLDFSDKTLENLDFSKAIMEDANFWRATIRNVNFTYATIMGDKQSNNHFTHAIIKNVNFARAIIKKVDFSGAKIENSHFEHAPGHENGHGNIVSSVFAYTTIENSTFSNMTIEDAKFIDVEMINTEFHSVEFLGGHFEFSSKKKMKISSQNDLPEFFCTEFRHIEFDFADEINSSEFFKLCYCHKNQYQHLSFLSEDKKYEYIWERENVFVDSGSWSGESVNKRVLVETLKHKLKHIERLLRFSEYPKNRKDLEDIKEDLEKKKCDAETDLENDTNEHSSNS